MSQAEQPTPKPPSLFRNYISFVGAAIASAALVSVVLLFLVEITSKQENPYLGILTYIVFPSILIFGLFIIILGRFVERRRRQDRKSTRLNSSHSQISYAVFCLKKKKKK